MKKNMLKIMLVMTFMFIGINGVSATDACYVCNDGTGVYKWGSSTSSDDVCHSGYHIDSNIDNEYACLQAGISNGSTSNSNTTEELTYSCYGCGGSSDGVSNYIWATELPNSSCALSSYTTELECSNAASTTGAEYTDTSVTAGESGYDANNYDSIDGDLELNDDKMNCGNLTNIPKALKTFTSNLVLLIKIITPIILIIMGMIDFLRATTSGDDKAQKEAQSRFIRRIIGAVIIFMSFSIVQLILSLLGNTDSSLIANMNLFINGECTEENNQIIAKTPLEICKTEADKYCENKSTSGGILSEASFTDCTEEKYKVCNELQEKMETCKSDGAEYCEGIVSGGGTALTECTKSKEAACESEFKNNISF